MQIKHHLSPDQVYRLKKTKFKSSKLGTSANLICRKLKNLELVKFQGLVKSNRNKQMLMDYLLKILMMILNNKNEFLLKERLNLDRSNL